MNTVYATGNGKVKSTLLKCACGRDAVYWGDAPPQAPDYLCRVCQAAKDRAQHGPVRYVPEAMRQKVWNKSGGRCWYCGLVMAIYGLEATMDHVVPRAAGGTSDVANLVPCCRICNRLKQDGSCAYLRARLAGAPQFDRSQRRWLEAHIKEPWATGYRFWHERPESGISAD
jgi:hypothetical protein